MCPAPMRTTIVELVEQFQRATPHKVKIVHTPSRFIIERVQRRRGVRRHDPDGAMRATDLIKQGKLAQPRRRSRAPASVWLCWPARLQPDVTSADAVKRTLLAAKTFARNEGAESGMHMLRCSSASASSRR